MQLFVGNLAHAAVGFVQPKKKRIVVKSSLQSHGKIDALLSTGEHLRCVLLGYWL